MVARPAAEAWHREADCRTWLVGRLFSKRKSHQSRPAASNFIDNQATGGAGAAGGIARGGTGGDGGNGGAKANGGAGGRGAGGVGGNGGSGNSAEGAGLFDAGTASFTGIVVNFQANAAVAGLGGAGGIGGQADGGAGGNGGTTGTGGNGGSAQGGTGGNGGNGSTGRGGGILVATTGTLTLKPRLGVKKSKAIDTITANSASILSPGAGGSGGRRYPRWRRYSWRARRPWHLEPKRIKRWDRHRDRRRNRHRRHRHDRQHDHHRQHGHDRRQRRRRNVQRVSFSV